MSSATEPWRRCGLGTRFASAGAAAAFTLVELLAVVTIIVLLAGLVMGLASYATRRAGIGKARTDLAVLGAACEAFNSDQGRYPTSTVYRLSVTLYWEGHNSALLLDQLAGGGYVAEGMLPVQPTKFVPCEVPTNTVNALIDPWATPYSYYCTYPRLVTSAWMNVTCDMLYEPDPTAGYGDGEYLIGGQQRPQRFDLFSYGPDKRTYAAGGSIWNTLWPVITRVRGAEDDDLWE